MTPKDKAIELVDKFYRIIPLDKMTIDFNIAKKCALIAVYDILKIVNIWSALNMQKSSQVIFWEEVKQEIEKL